MSSIGASAMPWRAKSFTAALTLCPIFSTAGSSSIGSSSASASASGTCPAAGSSKSPPVAGDVPERQVGRLARPDRRAEPDELRPHLVRRRRLHRQRHRAAVADPRQPVGERRPVARASRCGPGRSAAAPPARARAGAAGPCAAAASGSITGGATPSFAATRPARPRNSISPRRRAAPPRRARAPRARRAAPRAARRALERHQRRARRGSARRGRSAPRAASAA